MMRTITAIVVAVLAALSAQPEMVLAKEKVQVGFIGPLTGGVSANGLGGRNSADLAVRQRNSDANAKYEYDLVVLDDECKTNVGVRVATKMASDRSVIAAVTHYCSAVAISTVDVYHRFGLPVVVWGAVLPDVTYGNDHEEIHRVNGTMINQNQIAAEFMRELGYESWVIIHDTTDYGKGHKHYFSKFLTENGGTILDIFGVTADQQDFTAELTNTKALDPDVIYFGGLTPIGVRLRAQMDKLGVDAQFQGTSGIISDAFINGLGPLAEGAMAFREGAPIETLPGGRLFKEQYEAQDYDQAPEAYGPFAFAAMNLVLDAIEAVGPDRRDVRGYLNAVRDREAIIGLISFDDHGQNTVSLITKYVVQDGMWVPWGDSDYASGGRKLNGR